MNPAGKVRGNLGPIAKGYSVHLNLFYLRASHERSMISAPDADVLGLYTGRELR